MFDTSLETAVCVGGVVSFVFLLAFLALMRYLNYRETLALAERGLVRPQAEPKDGKGALRGGIMTSAVGLALSVGLWSFGRYDSGYPLGFGPWMIVGLLPLFVGLGLILIYVLTRKPEGKEK
jgi:Domain of unknown function (DUF6249)